MLPMPFREFTDVGHCQVFAVYGDFAAGFIADDVEAEVALCEAVCLFFGVFCGD